jgi:rhamnulokinase
MPTRRIVVAGPVEATAIGSILVQAAALGYLSSLAEGRAVVKRSFDETVFTPGEGGPWDSAFGRYLRLRSGVTSTHPEE